MSDLGTGLPGIGVNTDQGAGAEQQAQRMASLNPVSTQQTRLTATAAAQAMASPNILEPVIKPIEWAGSKMYQVYSDYISRPASTALLFPQILDAENKGAISDGGLFSSEAWDRAWKDAAHVSVGQAAFGSFDFAGTGSKIGYNQNTGQMIWDDPNQVHSFFSQGSQKWISGTMDAGFSWYADPFTVAGMGLKGARAATEATTGLNLHFVQPGTVVRNETFKGALTSAAIGLVGKTMGRDAQTINAAQSIWNQRLYDTSGALKNLAGEGVNGSVFTRLGDHIEAQQAKQGEGFASWVTNQRWAQGGGGALAVALSHAKNRQDINDVLATAMGDVERPQSAVARSQALQNQLIPEVAQQVGQAKSLPQYNAELGVLLQKLQRDANATYAQIKNPLNGTPAIQLQLGLQHQETLGQMQVIQDEIGFLDKTVGKYNKNAVGDLAYGGGGVAPSMASRGIQFNPTLSPAASAAAQWARSVDYRQLRGAGSTRGFIGNVVYNNTFVRPVRIFSGQGWNDLRPNGWIKPDDPESYRELSAQINNSNLFTQEQRDQMVSEYIKANPANRVDVVKATEAKMMEAMAAKYGVSPEAARKLYNSFSDARASLQNRIYSAATLTDKSGTTYSIDRIPGPNGEVTGYHPVLVSQLQDSHPMMDMDYMDRVLKLNARGFNRLLGQGMDETEAARAASQGMKLGNITTRTINGTQEFADLANSLWKANILLRLGYGVRALSDDFIGQVARFGAASMALRAASGAGVAAGKATSWMHDAFGFDQKLTQANANVDAAQQILDNYKWTRSKIASRQYVQKRAIARQQQALDFHDRMIDNAQSDLEMLQNEQARLNNLKARMVDQKVVLPSGQVVNAFAHGTEGAMAMNINAGGRSAIDSGLGTAAANLMQHLRGSVPNTIRSGDVGFRKAWYQAVQHQIANDPLARAFAGGASVGDALGWMQKPAGHDYWDQMGLKYMQKSDHAKSVQAHIDHYLPVNGAETAALRAAVARGAGDREVQQLMDAVPDGQLPHEVHGDKPHYALGQSGANQMIDGAIGRAYHLLAQVPTEVLSRNPLAAELYHSHVMAQYSQAEAQGLTHLNQAQLDRISSQARKMAVDDVKRFTYNMDHETKLAYMTRFVMPFFGPMQEPINRWMRIMADKPDVAGKFLTLYNAPLRAGLEVDQNGNALDADGYTTDPATGQKTLVPIDQRSLQIPVPKWLAKGIGLPTGGYIGTDGKVHQAPQGLSLRIASLPLPFRNDPWYNPGEGPWVQMAVNQFAKSRPQFADTMQALGVLPYGVQKSNLAFLGGQLQRTLEPADPLQDARMQYQIWAGMNYQFKMGLRSTQPTWTEAKARAQHEKDLNNWLSSSGSWSLNPLHDLKNVVSFVMPVNMKARDPYQFFRDAYSNMVQANPATARQLFYQKYGEAAYAFTQSLTKDRYQGLPTTAKALVDSEKYQTLLDKYPDMAGVLLGPDGVGNYSASVNAILQMKGERTTMSPQDAWSANQVSLGWQLYSEMSNDLMAQLKQRGLTLLSDKGAEDLLHQKQLFLRSMASPTLPDGSANPYQNQDWAQAYYAQDPYKADDKAAHLTAMLTDPAVQKLVNQQNSPRQDLVGLAQYLELRASAVAAMQQNQNSKVNKAGFTSAAPLDINSKGNAYIKDAFQQSVLALLESNTDFQSLHDRYLANDMFDHYDGTTLVNTVYGGA